MLNNYSISSPWFRKRAGMLGKGNTRLALFAILFATSIFLCVTWQCEKNKTAYVSTLNLRLSRGETKPKTNNILFGQTLAALNNSFYSVLTLVLLYAICHKFRSNRKPWVSCVFITNWQRMQILTIGPNKHYHGSSSRWHQSPLTATGPATKERISYWIKCQILSAV